jgi:thiol:disulfide interchange protein DsbD
MIIDFWAEWCTACKELDRTAWADPGVRAEASRFVAVKVDTDRYPEVAEKYGIVGMPTVVFIDGRGREVPERVTGAVDGPEMVRIKGGCFQMGSPASEEGGPEGSVI